MTEVVIVIALPDGTVGAFTRAEVNAARSRAAALDFGAAPAAAPSAPPAQLLNSKELAKLVGANDTLLETMARDRRIPSVRIGRLLRFEPARVIAALRSQSES